MTEKVLSPTARLATVNELLQNTIPALLAPAPSPETLRRWLDQAKIPRFKANPDAKRGGGPVFYDVCAVEQYLTERTGRAREGI